MGQLISKVFNDIANRQYWTCISIKPDASLMKSLRTKGQETLELIQDANGLVSLHIWLSSLTKPLLESLAKTGGQRHGDIPV